MNRTKKFITLIHLYIAQSVPMSFFSTALPVILRMENVSLGKIGLLLLLKAPWILKFFWAPLVDKKNVDNSHYKKWIISSEVFYAVVILTIGFLKIETSLTLILGLMFLAFVLSATQDIASDALAVRLLKFKERGPGNSMQSAGSFLGALIGGSVLLAVYNWIGWLSTMILLAAFVLLALIPLLVFDDKNENNVKPAKESNRKPFDLFLIPGIWKRVLLLSLYYSGIIGVLAMSKPFLVDLGYTVNQIALLTAFGTGIAALSSFIAGRIIKRISHKLAITLFSAFQFIAGLFFVGIANGWQSLTFIYIGVCLVWAAYAMSSVIIYTVSMNLVRSGSEGSDFTYQIVITHASGIIIGVTSGFLAQAYGYKLLFSLESLLALLVLFLGRFLYKEYF